MLRPRSLRTALLGGCLALSGAVSAQPADPDASAVQAVVQSFHDALQRGDTSTVQNLLAADAVILESGQLESREQYLRHHLGADMAFAKAVPSRVLASAATVSGQTAWVHRTSASEGRLRDRRVKISGAELVVLTRQGEGWEIRAIHWSSQPSP